MPSTKKNTNLQTVTAETIREGKINLGRPSRKENLSRWALILGDFLIFLGIFLSARLPLIGNVELKFIQMNDAGLPVYTSTNLDWYWLIVTVALVTFRFIGLYSQRRTFWDDTRSMVFLFMWLMPIDIALLYLAKEPATICHALAAWLALFVFLPLGHDAVKRLLLRLKLWQKPTVIIGTGENAYQTYQALKREKILGFEVTLFADLFPSIPYHASLKDCGIPIIPVGGDPYRFFKDLGKPHVIVALEQDQVAKAGEVIDYLTLRPNAVDIVPSVRGIALFGLDVHHIFGQEILLLRTRNNLARRFPRLVKRLFDLTATTALLALLSPLFLVLSLLIMRDGAAPFYGHRRVGMRGKSFKCYKFRSMINNADKVLKDLLDNNPEARAEWEKDFKLKNDPRITKLGAFIRKTSIDELPQLFNVLLGQMSLVGPRPIVEEELERYKHTSGYYMEARPGISGLWQISGRNDIEYAYRVRLDVWYIKNWSFWYDIVILFKTIPAVLKRDGAY